MVIMNIYMFFYVYHRLIILGYITIHRDRRSRDNLLSTGVRIRTPVGENGSQGCRDSDTHGIYHVPSDRSTPARRHLFSHDCCSRERQSPHLLFRFRAARPITRIHTLMNVTRARDNWDQSYPMPVQIRTGMASFCFRRSVDPPTYGIYHESS